MNRIGGLATSSLLLMASFGIAGLPEQEASPKFSYVGASTCGMCHKSEKQGQQLKIWQDSIHAQAYAVLLTPEADRISQEKGAGKKAAKAEACLKCHATGYDVDKSLLGAKFRIEDGVQCETCHGPGSDYKSLKVMRDRQLAVQNGLIVHENVEQYCLGCHNPESPTHVSFDFQEMWSKIDHPVPKK